MSDKKGKSDKLEDKVDFRWLKKRGRGGKNKEIQFYESFRYDGIEYSLYDCVYLFKSGEREPYVGKLIKIWKRENNDKVVKVLWFFRPCEISNYLQGVNVLNNEIFLATGVGAGLTNLNPLDKSKWFTASPWKDRMKDAADQERLVLLQNLDPTYNLNEVEDIIWLAFHENCTVKIVQHTATSSPQAGQALAIFNHREVAQKVIQKLEQDCLILPNGRPLVGTNYMALPKKQSQYHGHLVIDKSKQQMQKDAMKREAVSTSHSAQSNTLEYEMALDWRLLQDRSDLCWKYLYKNQGEEMRKLKVRLKS